MKKQTLVASVLIMIIIACVGYINHITSRYDIYEGDTLIVENARLVAESESQITIVSEMGTHLTFSKNNKTVIKK